MLTSLPFGTAASGATAHLYLLSNDEGIDRKSVV